MGAALVCDVQVVARRAAYWYPLIFEAMRFGDAGYEPPWAAGNAGNPAQVRDGASSPPPLSAQNFRAAWDAIQADPEQLRIAFHVGETHDAGSYQVIAGHGLGATDESCTLSIELPLTSLGGEGSASIPPEEQGRRINRFITSAVVLYQLCGPATATLVWRPQGWIVGRIVPADQEEWLTPDPQRLPPPPPAHGVVDVDCSYLSDGSAFSLLSLFPVPDTTGEGQSFEWLDL